MYVLGISALDKDSSVTLFDRGRPIYAVAEERLTRSKRQDGFPWLAIEEALSFAGITAADLEVVAYPFLDAAGEALATLRHLPHLFRSASREGAGTVSRVNGVADFLRSVGINWRCHSWCDRRLSAGLRHYGLHGRLRRYDHEECHAASAYYSSGYDSALIQVSDWYGTGSSGGVYIGESGRIRQLIRYRWPHSLGGYYASFTEQLGFVPDLEEGKVLGLSAYGDPSSLFLSFLADFRIDRDGSFQLRRPLRPDRVRRLVAEHGRADVAAALQAVFETVLLSSLEAQVRGVGRTDICLAGGSMANVRLNHKIREIPGVERVFVFPAMADGGTGHGAGCLALADLGQDPMHKLEHVYLSRRFDEDEIERALRSSNNHYLFSENVELAIARLLAEGQIVARWDGRMEFGPRALGNRSILANPSDPSVVRTLNQRLGRTDFMPFAPSINDGQAHEIDGMSTGLDCARFMTMTFCVGDDLAQAIPATVHVDGTARIHMVSADHCPSLHKVIFYFHRLTGIPAVLNTSFNLHGEPIVYGVADALRTFAKAHLDYLAIGPFIVGRKGTVVQKRLASSGEGS